MERPNLYTIMRENELLNNAYFLIIALLLAFGTLQFAGTALSTEKPVVSVVSCSMYPEYNVGDILFVQGQSFKDIDVRDVIVYDVRNKAEISVGSNSYSLNASEEDPKPEVETEIGSIRLVDIKSNLKSDQVLGVLEINGDRLKFSEGDEISIDGEMVSIKSLSGIHIPIVHRVIEKNSDYLETKGDNNRKQLSFEKKVKEEQIHGKVVFRVPYLGNIKILAMDFTGLTGGQPFVFDTTPTCTERV